ncbi:hypothetical protein niasHS_002272 [Heterodera schachtii]|uniref:Uncharacterized protein n=1 Tax=Heterodera schachtii TaxID=97005 RepID=A0ABD2KJJ4_HETSC
MGFFFQCLDPSPPDESVRHFWHIRGVIVDASVPTSSSSATAPQQQNNSPSTDTLQVETNGGGQHLKKDRDKQRQGGNSSPSKRRTMASAKRDKVKRLPPGVLYVYEGRLVYRGRRWGRWCVWHRQNEELEIELCDIEDVKVVEQFVSQRDNRPVRRAGALVEVFASSTDGMHSHTMGLHFGILTDSAEMMGKELRDTFQRHRQRPRIFQFNSVDIEGVEIDVP